MSEDSRKKGKLIPILFKPNQGLSDKVKQLAAEALSGKKLKRSLDNIKHYEDPLEWLNDVLDWGDALGYYFYFDEVYEILYKVELEKLEDTYFADIKQQDDGSVDFHILYYNSCSIEDYFYEYFKNKKNK